MPTNGWRSPLVIAVMLILTGCTSADRPDLGIWRQSWEQMTAVVPEREALGTLPRQEICQEVLADLRDGTSTVVPAPSNTVEDLVHEWISVAETAFFECPPREHDFESMDDAYAELDRIEESIETALDS